MNYTQMCNLLRTCIVPAAPLVLGVACAGPAAAAVQVAETRCEYLVNPLGIDVLRPRLSWKIVESDPQARGQRQTAYQILVASDPALLARDKGDLWDSGHVHSDQSALVEYAGKPLHSRSICYWKVRVWDKAGKPSAWSAPASWTVGLLQPEDWQGKWIGGANPVTAQFGAARWVWFPEGDPAASAPAGNRFFRREFALPEQRVKSARLLITADNSFTLAVNGEKVGETARDGSGDEWRKPASFDVAKHLRPGANVLAVVANNAGAGTPAGLLANLRIEFETGEPLLIVTDHSWQTAQAETPGWQAAGFNAAGWQDAKELAPVGGAPWGEFGQAANPDRWMRKTFSLSARPKRAFAYVGSLGYHELYVNGRKASDAVLTPSISDLGQRVRYVTYDITDFLQDGKNVVALWLGVGWASHGPFHQPNRPLAIAQVEVTPDKGQPLTIATDETWRAAPSSCAHLQTSGWFGGEHVEMTAAASAWNAVNFDDAAWTPARVFDPKVKLSAEMIEPNRKETELRPVQIEARGPGIYRVDMGRSFTGWVEAKLHGKPGETVRLSISERPEAASTFGMVSECVLDAAGEGTFTNRFNYSAGRWITLEGLTTPPTTDDIRGYLVRTDYRRATQFQCSDELLNRIYDTTLWTFECLSLGGYTVDCPHRERMGYGGDAHATMETALKNYGMGAFYTKWLGDWRDLQKPDGDLPYTAPTYNGGGGPSWSGIIVSLPWAVYQTYGDRRVLADNYPNMQRFLAFLDTKAQGNILQKWGGVWDFLGDWVPPGKDQGGNRVDELSTLFYNNCYYVYMYRLSARIAAALGKEEDAARYEQKADVIAQAVHQRFFHPETNTYANGDQLYEALPLLVGVTPQALRPAVLKALETEILVNKKGHLDTGIHGTYFLIKSLLGEERNDLIGVMASQRTYPGWGYMLEKGATTIWEQWDGENSLLHSSFLSIGFWFPEGVAGIRPDPAVPGYKHFFIKPGLVGNLTWAKAAYDSIYGPIRSEWHLNAGEFSLDVTVPPNTTATLFLPADSADAVSEGGLPASHAPGVHFQRQEGKTAVFDVQAGTYHFTCKGR